MASSTHSSSITATELDHDVESQEWKSVSHWTLLLRPAGVNGQVMQHKFRGHGTPESPYAVDFLPNDPHNPMNFPTWKKWTITMSQAFAVLAVAFSSTSYTGGVVAIVREFNASDEVAILGISLFICGFAFGPLLWAPMSEFFGRQVLFFSTYFLLVAFCAGTTASPNIQTLIVMRFLAGMFGSSPLTNSGGVIADMFPAAERGLAMAIFAMAPFLGPSLGPIASGYLGEAAGWRWVEGLTTIFCGVMWMIVVVCVPETYAPVILRKRAAKLSEMTGKTYLSKLDVDKPKKSMSSQFWTALSRPWVLLVSEPIVFLLTLYMSVLYGTLYMMFPAFPIVFAQGRGWSVGASGLAFLGIAVGSFLGVVYSVFDNVRYTKVSAAHNGAAPPEARLPGAMVSAVLIPAGLFWFAWTNGPEVHWIVPIIASAVFAMGIIQTFLSLNNYLVDSYVIYAASVLAANAVVRSLFGAAFPLFTTYMYKSLGIHWASSIPAFLAVACIPFPFLFYRFGPQIRMKCKYAAEAAAVLQHMRTLQSTTTTAAAAAAAAVPPPPSAQQQQQRQPAEENGRRSPPRTPTRNSGAGGGPAAATAGEGEGSEFDMEGDTPRGDEKDTVGAMMERRKKKEEEEEGSSSPAAAAEASVAEKEAGSP